MFNNDVPVQLYCAAILVRVRERIACPVRKAIVTKHRLWKYQLYLFSAGEKGRTGPFILRKY